MTTRRTRALAGLTPGRLGRAATGRARIALPVALLIGVTLAGCSGTSSSGTSTTSTSSSTSATTGQPVDLTSLLADPATYQGQKVTVTGTGTALAPNVLTLTPTTGGTVGATGSPTTSAGATGTSPTPLPATSGTAGASRTAGATTTGTAGSASSGTGTSGTGGAATQLYVLYRGTTAPQSGTVTATGTVKTSFTPEDAKQLGITIDETTAASLGLTTAHAILIADSVEASTLGPSGSASASGSATGTGTGTMTGTASKTP